jgi:serine/threonine-protein kinase
MAVTYMDRETFLAHLRRSELLTPEQFAEVTKTLPDTHRGRLVARLLVQQGVLTRFQAEMLLAGRTNGFQLGQYRILAPLGRGGMGRVFQALHLTMNRIVALKLVAPQLVKTEVGRRLFAREVRAAARLVHPNIVTAYDANQIGDRLYLIMEYVDGPNLEELVRERGPLDIGLACEFIRQAALGLQHAFEMGMVHRDIKPANLLVQRAGGRAGQHSCVVKILDFGLARFRDTTGHDLSREDSLPEDNGAVLGTPDFISPEQARECPTLDIRSDLYSLGGTLYYLLTGQVPFPGGTNLEKLVRHGTTEPQPAEELRPAIPNGIRAILRRLLAKDPAKRFQTPAEVAEALAPFAVNGPPCWTDSLPRPVTAEASRLPSSGPSNEGARTAIIANFVPEPMLMNTVSGSRSATPFSVTGLSAVLRRRLRWQAPKPWRPWIMATATLLAAGLGWMACHFLR